MTERRLSRRKSFVQRNRIPLIFVGVGALSLLIAIVIAFTAGGKAAGEGDTDGEIRYRHGGIFTPEVLESHVTPLLKGQ